MGTWCPTCEVDGGNYTYDCLNFSSSNFSLCTQAPYSSSSPPALTLPEACCFPPSTLSQGKVQSLHPVHIRTTAPVHTAMVATSSTSVHLAVCSATQWHLAPKGCLTSAYSPLTMTTTTNLHYHHLMVITYSSITIYYSQDSCYCLLAAM